MKACWDWTAKHIRWILGEGKLINFWTDRWINFYTIVEILELPQSRMPSLSAKVVDFIYDGNRCFPMVTSTIIQGIINEAALIKPIMGMQDKPIWTLEPSGKFSVSSA
ncbi:hypothetical protein NE237_022077 [Protea cynaroides]|uniref:Uncharacterized protein n=1 Tax=Protea cynaroides TaxID=273540 RepID=A0A9Q0HCE7_9MAGN|nr:hypothetical protein NE237_022077 [Protea cynaroides]